MKLFVRDDIKE